MLGLSMVENMEEALHHERQPMELPPVDYIANLRNMRA